MKKNISIQFKAAFLLLVFVLNTMVGFACSLGLDMGFNASHHKEVVAEPAVHIHANGKKHHHQTKTAKANVHVHADGKKHEHKSELVNQPHNKKLSSTEEKNGCCSDDVAAFQNLDKNLNQNANAAINAQALVTILSSFLCIDIFKVTIAPQQLYTARYLFPPPPDILISIQRFQV